MGSILHANAKTTPKIRKEIKESKESICKLAKRYNLNPKTIDKWRKRERQEDLKSGAKKVNSVLSDMEQKIICEFRRVSKLSLDDCYIALKGKIPKLSRSNLHRCLKRNGLSVLPKPEKQKQQKKTFKNYEMGYIHIDITKVILSNKQNYYLFVAIDRVSKYAYCEIYTSQTIKNCCVFLNNLIKALPYKIHTILTDNGSQFTYALLANHLKPKDKIHPFDQICQHNNITHKLTAFKHPWTNGQVEIMNKIIKEHTVKKYHYDNIQALKYHLMAFMLYYNHQKKLKSLKYNSPFDLIIKQYETKTHLFYINPNHMFVELNN